MEPAAIDELDWWEETRVNGVRLVSTSARHLSGRSLTDRDATLWSGWAFVGAEQRAWHSDDTALTPELREIGRRLGPFDVTMNVFSSAQPVLWLIGATDEHAKNFGLFLFPQGRFRLTPLYDVLSLQPQVDVGQVRRRAFRLSMAVGERRHYRVHDVLARRLVQSAKLSRMPHAVVERVLERVVRLPVALVQVERELPGGFPERLHESIGKAAKKRLDRLRT